MNTEDYLRYIFYQYQRDRLKSTDLFDLWCDEFDRAVDSLFVAYYKKFSWD